RLLRAFIPRRGHSLHVSSFPTRRSSDLLVLPDRHVGVERVGKDFLSRNTSRYRFTSPLQPTRLPQLGEKHRQTGGGGRVVMATRSEEHTSELQSRSELVCRHLVEKKKLQ